MSIRLRWEHLIGLLGALGLFAIPFIFTTATPVARYDAFVMAGALAVTVLLMLLRFQRWHMWLVLAIGGWLMVAPSVLHFIPDRPLMWTHEIIGVGLMAIAFSTLLEPTAEANAQEPAPDRKRRFASDREREREREE